MPAPSKINPALVQILFDYNPDTGELIPKPTTHRAAYRTAKNQWEIGEHRYTTHRLIWAWHNPNNANPYAVQFIDGDQNNTRIENLHAIHTNPRWLDHNKKQRMYMRADGTIVPMGSVHKLRAPETPAEPKPVIVRASVQRQLAQEAAKQAAIEAALSNFEEEVSQGLTFKPVQQPQHPLAAIVNEWDD